MATVMYAPGGLKVMGVCDGPTPDGRCPRAGRGEQVHCRGLDLVLTSDDPRSAAGPRTRVRVGPEQTTCPLRAFPCRTDYFSPFAVRA
jgi:hypothetical protein